MEPGTCRGRRVLDLLGGLSMWAYSIIAFIFTLGGVADDEPLLFCAAALFCIAGEIAAFHKKKEG